MAKVDLATDSVSLRRQLSNSLNQQAYLEKRVQDLEETVAKLRYELDFTQNALGGFSQALKEIGLVLNIAPVPTET